VSCALTALPAAWRFVFDHQPSEWARKSYLIYGNKKHKTKAFPRTKSPHQSRALEGVSFFSRRRGQRLFESIDAAAEPLSVQRRGVLYGDSNDFGHFIRMIGRDEGDERRQQRCSRLYHEQKLTVALHCALPVIHRLNALYNAMDSTGHTAQHSTAQHKHRRAAHSTPVSCVNDQSDAPQSAAPKRNRMGAALREMGRGMGMGCWPTKSKMVMCAEMRHHSCQSAVRYAPWKEPFHNLPFGTERRAEY
jgi:hypothetical protein